MRAYEYHPMPVCFLMTNLTYSSLVKMKPKTDFVEPSTIPCNTAKTPEFENTMYDVLGTKKQSCHILYHAELYRNIHQIKSNHLETINTCTVYSITKQKGDKLKEKMCLWYCGLLSSVVCAHVERRVTANQYKVDSVWSPLSYNETCLSWWEWSLKGWLHPHSWGITKWFVEDKNVNVNHMLCVCFFFPVICHLSVFVGSLLV